MPPRVSNQNLWLLTFPTLFLILPEIGGGFSCLSNPCIHGVCIDDLNTTYSCYCIDGYTGVQCQTNWDECWSNPCQNGGICTDGIAAYNCSCPAGYVGEICETDYNECESNPCLNNATCVDATNEYTCNCLPGYLGIHCELDIAVCNSTNETRCANGGICIEGPGMSFSCQCQPGWGGYLCEREIDECMSAPCQNGAVCIDLHADYSCACLFGYSGKNCEEIVLHCEDNPCRNSALCLMEEGHPVCYCVPDYHGDRCQYQYDECQLGPRCLNGGTCIDGIDSFTCSCPPKLTGVLCECLIVGETTLDCTYVSPTTPPLSIFISESTTSPSIPDTTNLPTMVPNKSTTVLTPSSTTEIITSLYTEESSTILTNISLPSTTPDDFTSTQTISTYYQGSTVTSTLMGQVTDALISSTTVSIDITPLSFISTTELTTRSTTEETTEPSTAPTEITTPSTTQKEETTPDLVTVSTTTEAFSVTSTEFITTLNMSSTFDTTTTEQSTTAIQETVTTSVVYTSPPTISSLSTHQGRDGNITLTSEFTESTTIFPSTISTFLTQQPTEATTEMSSSTMEEFSTPEAENLTRPPLPDCSNSETPCQHGGSCGYTTDGFKCFCPYDTEGILCEVHLGIKNAAFGGDSFLSHRLTNTSNILVEFKAKTLSSNGLIFYANVDSSYITLYITNGYLMFRFSCGFQTMLLSELRIPINNGFYMSIATELEFSKDFKRCNASVKVNNTLTMSGDQVAVVNQFTRPISWLHLGGVPQEYVRENLDFPGFMGCMSDLKVSGKKVNIFKDAEDGYQIYECSSLVCLSNPCNNGGSCVENEELWSCKCKNGFVGKTCEKSVCDNNPCQFGATCLPFTGSGYICLCPFGKHGQFCENDLDITEPYFSRTIYGFSSFAAYPIPRGALTDSMELKFKFTPTSMEQISILMFVGQNGQHDSTSDHMAVSFVKGYIMLTWNLGSGPRRIFTSRPIDKGKKSYLVQLGRFGRKAWLVVDNLANITGRSPRSLAKLNVAPLLFIGGHSSRNFSILPHDLPLHTGFSGCIFDVELKSGTVVIPLQHSKHAIGRALGQCGTTECHERSCQNGGACLHHGATFTCLCQDGWFGPLCLSKHNSCDFSKSKCSPTSSCVPLLVGYDCDCPIGQKGKFCEKDEILSDVSFSGKRSFLSLALTNFDSTRFNIQFELRPLSMIGLVLYIGHGETSFVSLSIQSSMLELRVLPVRRKRGESEVLAVRSNNMIAPGEWYKIRLGIFGTRVFLSVNDISNVGVIHISDILLASKEIYLGGLPDMSLLPTAATTSFPVSFTGCIRGLNINTIHIPLTEQKITNARNIADCDGTPCGRDACENGGMCWLDPNLNAHCSCKDPYIGDRCETVPSCEVKRCEHRGRCLHSRCYCTVGWTGAFCETMIRVKMPEFLGKNSYLVIKSVGDKKRDLGGVKVKDIYMNFTTAVPNGMILWSQKEENFIGIGLEKGRLKLAYSSKKSNKTIIEIPAFGQIADGMWHTLRVLFSSPSIHIEVDKKIVHMEEIDKDVNGDRLLTDGMFFLGGLSSNDSLLLKTQGVFPVPFVGCIETFGLNENYITDFSNFDGENVDVCSFF